MQNRRKSVAPTRVTKKQLGGDLSVIITINDTSYNNKFKGSSALITLPNDMYLIDYQIQAVLSVYPKADIVVVTGYCGSLVRNILKYRDNVRLVYNSKFDNKNICHSLTLGLYNVVNKNVLIMYGDTVFSANTISGIIGDKSRLLIQNGPPATNDNVGTTIHDDLVTHLSFGLENQWMDIAYITGDEFLIFESVLLSGDSDSWFGYEMINKIIDDSGKFYPTILDSDKIGKIETQKDIENSFSIIRN